MALVLGIDTGGTYTDGVLVDNVSAQILKKAKTPTTKEDLTLGIRNCINALCLDQCAPIDIVALSTTLATNAIVEGRGCKVGLILIGREPKEKLPTTNYFLLSGRTDIKGRLLSSLKEEEIRAAAKHFQGKVGAIAISGYASIRNPQYELYVKKKIQEILSLPVVCAHELTTSLGFYDRTVTAVLNAKIIPIICELLDATNTILKENHIDAPVLIVKGDGSLMSAAVAREKPIDTLLSGPAASIIGGSFLTQVRDAVIMDMGGTTTDVAHMDQGFVRISQEGARVGGWLTRVQAARIDTFGIGGDSYLQLTSDGRIKVGPRRVIPLAMLGYYYPEITEELNTLPCSETGEVLSFLRETFTGSLSRLEQEMMKILKIRPRSRYYLAQRLGQDPGALDLDDLVDLGLIARSSVTPTDILHVKGSYTPWNRKTARAGVKNLAARMGRTLEEVVEIAEAAVAHELASACRASMPGDSLYLDKPIVAIGAPAQAWFDRAAHQLQAKLIIPEHADVASAVGAAVGKIVETVKIIIRPGNEGRGFIMYAPWERKYFDNLEDAVNEALASGKNKAAAQAEKSGTDKYELIIKQDHIYSDNYLMTEKIYIETRIEIIATGSPTCYCPSVRGTGLECQRDGVVDNL
jgi:N-methylhydantoinase A/oxoprolinase/acetone carboxylase beta subunit